MMPRTFAVWLLIPVFTACTVGPRYTRPTIDVPDTWREGAGRELTAAERAALERWWTELGDPTLEKLVQGAVAGNLDLKIAAARVQEARAARGIAASAGKPQIDGAAAATRASRSEAAPPFEDGGGNAFGSRTQDVFEVGFDASWELDLFGGVRRDVEAAVAQVQAAEESRRDVLISLLAEVARSYAELRGAQRRLEILEATVGSQEDTLELARARFEAGMGSELDVARAQALLDATVGERPELEREARRAMYRIGVLVGQSPGALVARLETPAPMPTASGRLPVTFPSELLSRRPDLRRAERELAAATARVGVATADLFPRFFIAGNLGRRSDEAGELVSGESQFWSIGPRVHWPLLSGGRIRAKIRVQNARQEQAVHRYEQAILTALEEVENALSAHARELRRQQSLRASVEANRRAVELAAERYTGGVENFLSVLDAQRSLYAADDRLAQSETRVVVSMIAIYKALGGGWSSEDAQVGRRLDG
jgi:NodT family efflux transporter outer membrane factor (OMF) lipoprotein